MSKPLIFFTIGLFSYIGLVLFEIDARLASGIIMLCMFFIFHATLDPMTNTWSYLMASKKDRVKAVREYESKYAKCEDEE